MIEEKRNYRKEIAYEMTNSDIMEIVVDKKKEIARSGVPYRCDSFVPEGDYRDFFNWCFFSYHSEEKNMCQKVVKYFEWELRNRNGTSSGRESEDLEQLKRSVNISEVVGSCVDMRSYRPGRNMKCPFPGHMDGTASFHIYEKTNTCRCFGCHKGGSSIDFLMEFHGVSVAKAIEMLKKF